MVGRKAAWLRCRGFVGYSPRIENLDGILYQIDGAESPGFDEWWTFEATHDLGEVIRHENPWAEEVLARPGRFLTLVNHFFCPDQGHQIDDLLWKEF